MKSSFSAVIACLALAALGFPAVGNACPQATKKMVEERQRKLESFREIKGTYRIVERIEREVPQYDGEVFTRVTLIGYVEGRSRNWYTVHSFTDELIMCASFYPPKFEGEGVFYLSRRKAKPRDFAGIAGRPERIYRMRHWDGDYLQPLRGGSEDEESVE